MVEHADDHGVGHQPLRLLGGAVILDVQAVAALVEAWSRVTPTDDQLPRQHRREPDQFRLVAVHGTTIRTASAASTAPLLSQAEDVDGRADPRADLGRGLLARPADGIR